MAVDVLPDCSHLDRYVRFVNLLMNDTTYLLDDALLHLGKIADIQKQMDDAEAWAAKPATERQEQEKLLRQYEGQTKSDLQLGHESLRLLKLFTAETQEPFLTPEIVDRLAAMLDMNLNMLAGPRCQDLRVKEMDKYEFKPKELLADVLQIFLQLGPRREFQEAVAKDGRSYSKDLFDRAERIARKTAIKTDQELAVLKSMVQGVEAIKAAEEEDDAMGEVPDDFLGKSRTAVWSPLLTPNSSPSLQILSPTRSCATPSCSRPPRPSSTAVRSSSTTSRTRPIRSTVYRSTGTTSPTLSK